MSDSTDVPTGCQWEEVLIMSHSHERPRHKRFQEVVPAYAQGCIIYNLCEIVIK